jgi:hypothetical protein
MSDDSFTEFSSQSWFSRIGNSIKGILFGIVLIAVSIALLSWNEGRAVKRYKTLKEGAGAVVSVNSEIVEPSNAGKLIHTSGDAVTEDQPSDPEFGISVNALKLIRKVEMYQWEESQSKETKKKLGGGTETVTTYDYSKKWSEQAIPSSKFKKPSEHTNPAEMRFQNESFLASPVTLGAFTLSASQVSMIRGSETYSFDDSYKAPKSLGKVTQSPTTLYIGNDPTQPEIGDLRISFSTVSAQPVSLIAAQVNKSFEPYTTQVGGTINLLQNGTVSADAMIQTAQDNNKAMTWALRGVGLVLMFIGFNMLMAPLSVLADIVPFIGNIVEVGTSLIAMLMTGVCGLLTIAVAWIVFRPVLGVSLLVVCAAIVYLIFTKMKTAKA